MMKNNKGFSLIELLIVMGIAIVILSISILAISANAANAEVDVATNMIKSTLNLSKAKATLQRRWIKAKIIKIGDNRWSVTQDQRANKVEWRDLDGFLNIEIHIGDDEYEIKACSVTFDKDGSIKQIEIDGDVYIDLGVFEIVIQSAREGDLKERVIKVYPLVGVIK
jgi:type II secretory pathway pseudopilin PulG